MKRLPLQPRASADQSLCARTRRFHAIDRERLLDDRFQIEAAQVVHERFDGTMSQPRRRLVMERGDAAGAVLVDRHLQKLLFTEQFRFPATQRGPGWLVEIVAGVIEPNETAEACIRREIVEELGYRVGALEPLYTFFSSPGVSSERVTLFYAEVCDADQIAGAGGGVANEGEDIRLIAIPIEQARDALAQGQICDAKTLIGLQWFFARERSLPG